LIPETAVESDSKPPEEDTENGTQSRPDAVATMTAAAHPPPPHGGGKAIQAKVWHKSPYPTYRIAGLVLRQHAQTMTVTEAQMEALRRDPWAVVEE